MAKSGEFIEITDRVPVRGEFDVIVAGGGVSGVAAALAAKRQGLSVLLVEKLALLGGLATSGVVNLFVAMCNGRGRKIIFGYADELLKLAISHSYDTLPEAWKQGGAALEAENPPRYVTRFSPNIFAVELADLLYREGINFFFDCVASEPVMKGNHCEGLVLENKSGREFYRAKFVVDATGDADVLFRAGVPTVQGKNYFTLSGKGVSLESCRKALESNNIEKLFFWSFGGNAALSGRNHPEGMPLFTGTTVESVSEYLCANQRKMLERLKESDRFSRDVAVMPTMAQFRTTRHIDGAYTLQTGDVYRHFADSIAAICQFEKRDELYEVPYGTLYHPDFDNLITCGRSAAAAGYAWDVLRVIPPAIITGQAAGEAVALALRSRTTLPKVDVKALQSRMLAGNSPVHFDDAWVPADKSGSSETDAGDHF